MSNLLQDFFRPDLGASNRALKKYLDDEGFSLGFRDLVVLRGAAQENVLFSFALLESWSAGELSADTLSSLLSTDREAAWNELTALCGSHSLSCFLTSDGLLLIGVQGELDQDSAPLSEEAETSAALVPLRAVYGGDSPMLSPGAGGAWKEEDLQAASLVLLDGESEEKLVEAFRHLFRAAPNGSARAAVVATALGRHRGELNREVADKLEEISPPLGQALRQLFTYPETEGKQALHFLLNAEASAAAPPWTVFWTGIRTTVLESLARAEKGRQVLRDSLRALHVTADATGANVMTHRLLDALLSRHDLFAPEDRSHLLALFERWTASEPAALETLASRLELAGDTGERILLGEALRRAYKASGKRTELARLMSRFAEEALSVGSTAGSLALAELLASFGPDILDGTALTHLDRLSERQTLNAMAMWEQLAGEDPEILGRVSELYVQALREAEQHWGLLLKSSLLQAPPIRDAFVRWCAEASVEERRRVVQLGQTWTLTVENRPLVAAVLGELDWQGADLWMGEWRRTTLSFQRLGWLAECLQGQPPTIDDGTEARIQELLASPRRNLYFWDLMKRLAAFPGLSSGTRDRIASVARKLYRQIEAGLDDEKEALLMAATSALTRCEDPGTVLEEWGVLLKTGSAEDLRWLFGLIKAIFSTPEAPFVPERAFVSSLIQKLFLSGPDSMQQALSAALDENDSSLTLPAMLSLELQNLGLEALAAVAAHPMCSPAVQGSVERRLALFLNQWGQDLARTDDVYSFRATPLFELLEPLVADEKNELQKLLDEVAGTFLGLQRRHPERLRLEVRQSAQSFFARWSALRAEEENPDVGAWRRLLHELSPSRGGS